MTPPGVSQRIDCLPTYTTFVGRDSSSVLVNVQPVAFYKTKCMDTYICSVLLIWRMCSTEFTNNKIYSIIYCKFHRTYCFSQKVLVYFSQMLVSVTFSISLFLCPDNREKAQPCSICQLLCKCPHHGGFHYHYEITECRIGKRFTAAPHYTIFSPYKCSWCKLTEEHK